MEQGDEAAPEWIGEYRVKRLLGRGGFGEVYLAANRHTGEEVAVKVFRPLEANVELAVSSRAEVSGDEALRELRERFIAEARTLQSLRRVEAVVDVGHVGALAGGEPYYVMPYLPESLAGRIGQDVFERGAQADLPENERPRALDYAEGERILRRVLEGLSAAHGQGLVHRDVKPSNVLLDGEGNARVADFGIAKLPDSALTKSGMGMGSRNYMAPEQRESARHVGASADVYSFGRLAYRVLTGRLPEGRYADPMELAPRMGRGLSDLIVSCLAEQPDDRPGTAGKVLERWRAALAAEEGRTAAAGETEYGALKTPVPAEDKPLREEIVKALLARGDVAHVRDKLEILALAARLDEAKLDRLIERLREEHRDGIAAVQALSKAIDHALSVSRGDLSDEGRKALVEGARAQGVEERLGDLVAWRQEEYWRKRESPEDAGSSPGGAGGAGTAKAVGSRAVAAWFAGMAVAGVALYFVLAYWPPGGTGKPWPFTVVVEPAEARVRLLDHADAYRAGMELPSGEYEVEASLEGYETKTETVAHGETPTVHRLSLSRLAQPFTIVPEPARARVRILNIGAAYRAGMELAAGSYEVEVSLEGYEMATETVSHGAEPTVHRIALRKAGLRVGEKFRDCRECPEMVVLPAGSFEMGSPSWEQGRGGDEGPVHEVTMDAPFALGVNEVTVAEFGRFVEETGYSAGSSCRVYEGGEWESRDGRSWRDPDFVQGSSHPAACVSWNDAKAYAAWLSRRTGETYRLPSESEWEYAARAGTAMSRVLGGGRVWPVPPCEWCGRQRERTLLGLDNSVVP